MPPAHHPLRRISTGSLSSLARSTDRSATSASGLEFLAPALTDLADEAATLASNTSQLTALHDALGTFNEAFAGYLYALKMNAFCVEWPEAPNELSFQRMEGLKEEPPESTAQAAPEVPTSPQIQPSQLSTNPADLTYATAYSASFVESPPPPPRPKSRVGASTGIRKPVVGVKKIGGALRRKRELEVAAIVDTLPLEYRGGDPIDRSRMEKVIMKLMEHPEGMTLKEMVLPPEFPQAKVNKCLITLVAKKLVTKPVINKVTRYKWVGA
ncbi:hypothetical protein L204_101473 [Cryptococcus depauperatus]